MTLLRTIQLGSHPLRVYTSPLDVPDHPWASFDNLMDQAGMDKADRPRWLAKLEHELPDMVHTLPDGTVIVAEPMVGGMFLAWRMMGCDVAQKVLDGWTNAWVGNWMRRAQSRGDHHVALQAPDRTQAAGQGSIRPAGRGCPGRPGA